MIAPSGIANGATSRDSHSVSTCQTPERPHQSRPPGGAQNHSGSVARPASWATSEIAAQPNASPTTECTTSHCRSFHVCGSFNVAARRARKPSPPWSR